MSLLVLGRTNDEKGAQLERIAQAMLSARGFRKVRLNAVDTGAAEYDVTAEWKGSGRASRRVMPVLGECKARKDPINMNDWQKFLGKVYAKTEKRREVYGLFITTSTPNGNVASSFENQRRQGKRLEFIGAIEIEEYLKSAYSVCSLQEATALVAKFTKRAITSIDLCYHDGACYWLVAFEEGAYTVLDAAGQPLKADKLKRLRPLLRPVAAVKKLINMYEEAEALRRSLRAQKHVIARLMLYGGGIRESDLLKESNFTREEIRAAATALAERGWVESVRGGLRFTSLDSDGRFSHIIDVLKFWLTGELTFGTLLDGIRSAFYDQHIDEKMLQEVLKLQGNLPLAQTEREGVIRLLKLSPNALLRALHPYPMITTERNEGNLRSDKGINETDRDLFYEYLAPSLVFDFRTRELAKHFWERGIWELEYRQNIIVKDGRGIMFETRSRSRHSIHPSNVQGGFIHLGVLNSEPIAPPTSRI